MYNNVYRSPTQRGLGRGLNALMGASEDYAQTGAAVSEIEIRLIDTAGDQPRTRFVNEDLEELALSIASHGLLQPILVESVDGRYRIIAGERRFRAARRAGLERIPAMIRASTKEERLTLALVENIQREDLTPIEEAKAYRRIIEMSGISQEELAISVGKNRSTIANSLRLLGLSVEAQAALSDGTITAGHARALLMIPDLAERQRLFERLKQYSVRQAEEYAAKVRARLTEAGSKERSATHNQGRGADPHLEELEQRLIDTLQTKVSVRGTNGRGKIEIRFFNLDDLERIQSVLLADK